MREVVLADARVGRPARRVRSIGLSRGARWTGTVQITIALAVGGLLFAVIQGPTSGWGSVDVIGGLIVAAVFSVAFILVERRSPSSLLDLGLFANRNFTIAAVVTVVGMFACLGIGYITSILADRDPGLHPVAGVAGVCRVRRGVRANPGCLSRPV